ncbi:MAG: 30S ribosome-binding factor RbfA [Pseudohongiellaceae bacterium]
MTDSRVQRVADQLQRELALLIQTEVDDPRLGMVSVTGIEVSSDLAYAKVFVTVMHTTAKQAASLEIEESVKTESVKTLNKAAGYLRTLLAKRLKMRTVPSLQFRYDESISRGQQLSELIDKALATDKQHS